MDWLKAQKNFVAPFIVGLMEAWGHFSEDPLYHIKELWENK